MITVIIVLAVGIIVFLIYCILAALYPAFQTLFLLFLFLNNSGNAEERKRAEEKRIKKEKERREREERYIRRQQEEEKKRINSDKYTKLFNDNDIVIKNLKLFYKGKLIKTSDITDVYYICCSDAIKNSYDLDYFNLIINYNSTKNKGTYISRKFIMYEKAECDTFIRDVLKYDLIKEKVLFEEKLINISDITDIYYYDYHNIDFNYLDYFKLIINYGSTKNNETYISRKFQENEKTKCDRFICNVLKKSQLIKKKEIYHCRQKIFFSKDWIRTDKEEIPYKDVYQKGIIKDGEKYRYKVNSDLSEPIADKGILNKIDFIIEKKLRNLNISFKNIRS